MEKLRKLHQEGYRSVWQQSQPQARIEAQPKGQLKVRAVLKPNAEEK
jgi:hypothetical protein